MVAQVLVFAGVLTVAVGVIYLARYGLKHALFRLWHAPRLRRRLRALPVRPDRDRWPRVRR